MIVIKNEQDRNSWIDRIGDDSITIWIIRANLDDKIFNSLNLQRNSLNKCIPHVVMVFGIVHGYLIHVCDCVPIIMLIINIYI